MDQRLSTCNTRLYRQVVLLLVFTVATKESWALPRENIDRVQEYAHDKFHPQKLDLLKRSKRNTDISTEVRSFFEEVNRFGALDVVFLLEKSPFIGKDSFYQNEVRFVKNLIRNYMFVGPGSQHTHVSLITYDKSVTEHFNGVASDETMTKCDLVEGSHLWANVTYEGADTSTGINLSGAIARAKEILTRGRGMREHARSHIVIFTSGSYDPNTINQLRGKYNFWFYAYLIGMAPFIDLAPLATVLTTKVAYNSFDVWKAAMEDPGVQELHTQVHFPSQWIPYVGPVCRCTSTCYCDVITGYTRCSCAGGYLDQYGTCQRPCDVGSCPGNLYECRPAIPNIHHKCVCRDNIGNIPCDPITINDCITNPCQNGGKCVDGTNQYSCMCRWGYTGRHCENFDRNCAGFQCPPGQQCTIGLNGPECGVPSARPPFPVPMTQPARTTPFMHFQPVTTQGRTTHFFDPFTTRWVSKTPPTKSTTTGLDNVGASVDKSSEEGFLSGLSNGERLMLIILPSAGVAFLVLIMGIGGLIYVLSKNARHRDKSNMSGLTETTSITSRNPSLMTFDSKCYKDEGTPGAPKAKALKAEEVSKITYGNFDDVMYDNEAIQRGMEEWYAYVLELYHNQGLNRILIVRLDGEKWVLSPGTRLYMEEIEKTYNLLSKTILQGTLKIQGREFGIVGNEDFVIMAHTFRNTKLAQEIACATKTRQFVIIATADFASDNGRCRQKVLDLRDHIKVQGL